MKRPTLILTAAALAATACTGTKTSAPAADENTDTLKIISYNVHDGIGVDTVVDYARIGRFLASEAPDFVAIQEVDSATTRSEGRFVLAEIAAAANMTYTFAPAIDFAGGRYGIGILSRTAPLSTRQIALPGSEEERTLLVAEFPDVVFCCTHLSLTEADRLASVPLIAEATAGYDKPLIICGDWNDTPSSPSLTAMREHFAIVSDTTTFTYPSPAPEQTIDYIAVRGAEAEVIDAKVYPFRPDSDHLPVGATIVLK